VQKVLAIFFHKPTTTTRTHTPPNTTTHTHTHKPYWILSSSKAQKNKRIFKKSL